MRDAGEGAGDDQADAGASIFGREYEMSLAANSREKLDQIEHALERLAQRHLRDLRVLRQPDREAAPAGRPARHPVPRVQDQAGAPLIPATPDQRGADGPEPAPEPAGRHTPGRRRALFLALAASPSSPTPPTS